MWQFTVLAPALFMLWLCSAPTNAAENNYNRWVGLFPNEFGFTYPSTQTPLFTPTPAVGDGNSIADYSDTIDTKAPGKQFDWTASGWKFRVFGQDLTKISCFDVGYCDDSNDGSAPRNPPTAFAANDLYFAPYWIEPGDSEFEYHMYMQLVESVTSGNPGPNTHYLDIATNLVRTGTSTVGTTSTWTCANVLVVTWYINDGFLVHDAIFQLVLADGGVGDDYVFMLYNMLDGHFGTPWSRSISGIGATKNAQICSPATSTSLSRSNHYCSSGGHYIFNVADGNHCDSTTVCDNPPAVTNWQSSTPNRNCIAELPTIGDSCTETAYCMVIESTKVKITFPVRWYDTTANNVQFLKHDTLDVITDPGCLDLTLDTGPNTDEIIQEITIPVADTTTTKCGMLLNTDDSSVKFAFKVFSKYSLAGGPSTIPSVLLSEENNYIVKGTCYYSDFPASIDVQPKFGDIVSTAVPTRANRDVELNFELQQHSQKTSTAPIASKPPGVQLGRKLWASVCFNPGTPFTVNADPYGVYVKDCYISDNSDFEHDGSTKFRVQVMKDGCRNTNGPKTNQAFRFTDVFKHDTEYNTDITGIGPSWSAGEKFCIISGYFSAAKWNHQLASDDMIYMRCTLRFCKNTGNVATSKCTNSCTGTKTDRRRRSVAGEEEEIVEARIRVIDPTDADAAKCVDTSVAIGTIGTLIAAIVAGVAVDGLLYAVYQKRKSKLGI